MQTPVLGDTGHCCIATGRTRCRLPNGWLREHSMKRPVALALGHTGGQFGRCCDEHSFAGWDGTILDTRVQNINLNLPSRAPDPHRMCHSLLFSIAFLSCGFLLAKRQVEQRLPHCKAADFFVSGFHPRAFETLVPGPRLFKVLHVPRAAGSHLASQIEVYVFFLYTIGADRSPRPPRPWEFDLASDGRANCAQCYGPAVRCSLPKQTHRRRRALRCSCTQAVPLQGPRHRS